MSFLNQFLQKNWRTSQAEELERQLLANEQADQKRFPAESAGWQPFLRVLQEALRQYAATEDPINASVQFFLTEDRMVAYACMLPPLDGGQEILPDAYGRALEQSGITTGIDDELALTYLAKRHYLHIFPIAKGVPKQDGTDGSYERLFEPRPVFRPEGKDGQPVDFSEKRPVQVIRKGEAVCRIIPATSGQDGVDVTGRKLPCRHGVPSDVQPGHNMQFSEDGLRIEATENGSVFLKNGKLYVQTAIVRSGDLQTDDDFVWLAYVDGDIPEGIKVISTSNIIVMGEIRGAEIYTKGCVRAQRGIRNGAHIEARRQVLAPIIEDSCIKAGMDVYAEEIRNSDVTSRGSIFVTGGAGRIQGGTIRAIEQVQCTEVGSEAGGQTSFILGYWQDLRDEIEQLAKEMDEIQSTLELLRKNILNLRMGGDHLSVEKRELLDQLVEQKQLYEERAAEVQIRQKEAEQERRNGLNSQLFCQQAHPLTIVQIGDHVRQFTFPETNCRFRLYAGDVVTY